MKARVIRRSRLRFRPSLLAAAVALCGCSDPYLREGTWHATGVNDDNLHAMVADPSDLQRGVSRPGTDGERAAAAVMRFRAGQVKPLQGDLISNVGVGGPSAAPPAPAPAGGN
jgi:hypothetical protein